MAELPAPPGDPDAFFDALLAYVAAVEPRFPEQVKGASPSEISRYETASRAFGTAATLPLFYGAFLRRMGKRDGGIFKDLRILVDIGELLSIYEDFAATEPESINPRLPIAGRYLIGDQIALDLGTTPADPEVVIASGGEAYDWLSQSWAHLLMQTSILYVERRRRSQGWWYSSSPESVAQALGAPETRMVEAGKRLDGLAAQLGLPVAWPSDRRHRVAIGREAAVLANIGRKGEVMLRVFSDNASTFRHVGDIARTSLGASGGEIR